MHHLSKHKKQGWFSEGGEIKRTERMITEYIALAVNKLFPDLDICHR